MDNVLLLPRSTATGYHDHNFVTVAERRTEHLADQAPEDQVRGRMHRVRAGKSCCARERMNVPWCSLTMTCPAS